MALARFLADRSALTRVGQAPVSRILGPLLTEGLLTTCAVIDLEMLFSSRSAADYAAVREERRGLPRLEMPDEVGERAIEIQELLARRGRHRAASIPDLLIAATAEHHGVTVLHYDGDFDLIAEVTGQPTAWVVPRGTVD